MQRKAGAGKRQVDVRKIAGACGAEILGIDLSGMPADGPARASFWWGHFRKGDFLPVFPLKGPFFRAPFQGAVPARLQGQELDREHSLEFYQ